MYIYDLATTGSISFGDFLVTTELVGQVSQTTQLRARVRAVLKENRAGTSTLASTSSNVEPTGVGATADWLNIVKVVEEYLPHLLAVFNSVQTDDLILRYEPVFSWRTSVSSARFRGAVRVELAGLHYELVSTLLTYALGLSNFAAATVSSLGSFERDRSISTEERKAKDERLRWSADTLSRAAGVLEYLSEELIPKWKNQCGGGVGQRVPELTSEGLRALSKICLAEAQAVAIRKLLSPSVGKAIDTVTPGPPLERDHPSASLLAKLHLCVVEEMESAQGLLRGVTKKKGGDGGGGSRGGGGGGEDLGASVNYDHDRRLSRDRNDETHEGTAKSKKLFDKFKLDRSQDNSSSSGAVQRSGPHDALTPTSTGTSSTDRDLDISSSLLKYLSFSTTFHRSIAYKWLAIDAGQRSSVGTAIAYLCLSSTLLSSAKDLSSGLKNITISSSSSLLLKKRNTSIIDQELETVHHWLDAYRKLNDTVSFQPVPSAHEVTSKVPAGRAALAVKAFQLPCPVWGPGSQGYKGTGGVGLAADQLHLLPDDHPARKGLVLERREQDEQGAVGGTKAVRYAAQGAYY